MYEHAIRIGIALAVLLSLAFPASANAATLVVANKAEASVTLLDLDSGKPVATLPTGEGPHEVGVSPDGRLALITNYGRGDERGNSLTLVDIASARVLKTVDLGDYGMPHGVEWLDQRRAVVTAEAKQALIVVDVENGKVEQAIDTGQEVSHMVALDPTRQRAYVANIGSGSLTVIDLENAQRLQNVPTGEGAEGVAVSPAGGHIWVTNRAQDTLSVLDADTLEAVRVIDSPGFPIRATAAPNGKILVTRARAGDLAVYDAGSFEQLATVAFDITSMDVDERLFGDRFGDSSVPIGVVVDGSGSRAFVAHANADVITEIDLDTGAIVRMLRAGKEPDGMAWSAIRVNGQEAHSD